MAAEHGPRPEPLPGERRGTGASAGRPAARRAPRRATGGTVSGAEPRLPGLPGPETETGEEARERAGEHAREEWLRAQRPPHWG
ncbi:hypothetical protein [Kocuria sp. U4B]